MDDTLKKFKEVVDEEIGAYEAMEGFYTLKQSILVKGDSDALCDVDAQILSKAQDIKNLNRKRKDIAMCLGNENITMSEIIEKAKIANDEIAESLKSQQKKIKTLVKSLTEKEKTNLTLIKHGLTMVEKTMDIIVEAISPQLDQYNNLGQSVEKDKSLISSVIEEA